MADVQRRLILAAGALNNRLYRLSGGRLMGSVRGVRVLLLTVSGRKSGVEHTTAVSYFKDGEGFVVTGSGGGSGSSLSHPPSPGTRPRSSEIPTAVLTPRKEGSQ